MANIINHPHVGGGPQHPLDGASKVLPHYGSPYAEASGDEPLLPTIALAKVGGSPPSRGWLERAQSWSLVRKWSLLLLLTGCTVGPDYTPPEIKAPKAWQEYDQLSENQSLPTWDQAFDDPILTKLINDLLNQNFDIKIYKILIFKFTKF